MKIYINKIFPILALILIIILLSTKNTSAAPVAGFQAGRIIDDIIFTNIGSMSVEQIQTFLNSKVPVCDNWGTNGSTPTSRRDYVLSLGETLPLKCLKEYTENGKTSAQIIYDAAQEYKINPQVLIVLLQKEQALVTDDWPVSGQYRTATGYGCPDGAPCDAEYFGFTNQVRWSARMFRAILNDSPTWYTPYELGDNYIQYNPSSSCGGTTVNIQNRATQALYNYTPYQPNDAALNAGYGVGNNCSSYGNRNFYLYFTDWFGSTYGVLPELGTRYNEISNFIGKLVSVGFCNNSRTICWQEFSNGYIIYSPQTGAWESKGAIREYWISIGAQSSVAGLPKGPEKYNSTTKSWSQEYQNGVIIGNGTSGFWFITNNIKERWTTLGAEKSLLGLPLSQSIKAGNSGWQEFENGFIIGNATTGFWESKGAIREYWASIGYQSSPAGWPVGSEKYDATNQTWSQEYQHGTIVGNGNTGFWLITNNIKERWTTLGAEKSLLGLPLSQSIKAGNSGWQEFENGFIIGNATTGFWESKGAIREYWASIGYQSSPAGWPVGSEKYDATNQTWSQEYQNGTIYYSELQKGSFVKTIETPQTTETTIIEKV